MLVSLDQLLETYNKTRSQDIKEKIIVESVGLVRFVVGRLPFVDLPGAEYEDLVGHGILGLITAIDRFDPSKGVKFETFASSRVKGAIIDALRKQNWLPRDLPRKMRMMESATAKLEATLLRHPEDEEIASELGLSRDEYDLLVAEIGRAAMVSLDGFIRVEHNGDSVPLTDILDDTATPNPEQLLDIAESKRMLAEAIESLSEREQLVLSLYYFEEMTLKEIGATLGVSESRVCQIHTRALLQLKTRLVDVQHQMAVS